MGLAKKERLQGETGQSRFIHAATIVIHPVIQQGAADARAGVIRPDVHPRPVTAAGFPRLAIR
jgi:hypothetical protein